MANVDSGRLLVILFLLASSSSSCPACFVKLRGLVGLKEDAALKIAQRQLDAAFCTPSAPNELNHKGPERRILQQEVSQKPF